MKKEQAQAMKAARRLQSIFEQTVRLYPQKKAWEIPWQTIQGLIQGTIQGLFQEIFHVKTI